MAEIERMRHGKAWADILESNKAHAEAEHPNMQDYERRNLILNNAFKEYLFACYCDDIRLKHATPWELLEGRKAAEMMAIKIHHWKPEDAAALGTDELMLALHQELSQFRLNPEAAGPCVGILNTYAMEEYIEHHDSSL